MSDVPKSPPDAVVRGQERTAALRHVISENPIEPLVRVANEIWRLRRRAARLRSGGPGEPAVDAVLDSVQRLEDVLLEAGIVTQDHEDETYEEGSVLEVLHQRDADGPLVVLETIRPTVRNKGAVVQTGQVVVGRSPGTQVTSP